MCGPPPCEKICVGEVDIELLWSLREWRDYLSDSQAEMNKKEREKLESRDCIEWFCSLVRNRLEVWKKDERYSCLFEPKYYPGEQGWLVR
jgi:hypothetical protein